MSDDAVASELLTYAGVTSYRREWHCEPPAWGTSFRVIQEEWLVDEDSCPVRRIYQWRPVEAKG